MQVGALGMPGVPFWDAKRPAWDCQTGRFETRKRACANVLMARALGCALGLVSLNLKVLMAGSRVGSQQHHGDCPGGLCAHDESLGYVGSL